MSVRVLALILVLAGCVGPPGDAGDAPPAAPMPSADWPLLEAALLRPGDKLRAEELRTEPTAPRLRGCTLNFVFVGADGTLYIGTASHCLGPDADAEGRETRHRVGDAWLLGPGVRATIAYCSWGAIAASDHCPTLDQDEAGHENDFALLRIDDADRGLVHPAMRGWAGPSGLAEEPLGPGDLVRTYGNSFLRDATLAVPDAKDAREGRVRQATAWTTYARFDAPSVHGDSGSPVIDAQGRAVGVVQTLEVEPEPGENAFVNLAPALAAVVSLGGPEVRLATWAG